MVGLKTDRKRILKEYSKGMRQRIGLAQALINDPELVILDEPTTGLDPIGTRWMKDLIVKLRDQGKTVLMCSHRLDDVQDVCDRIAILHNGELQELGEVAGCWKSPTGSKSRPAGQADRRAAPRPRRGAAQARRPAGTFGHPTTTLEELFLRIVEESKARPGRRYLPGTEGRPAGPAAARASGPGRRSSRGECQFARGLRRRMHCRPSVRRISGGGQQ